MGDTSKESSAIQDYYQLAIHYLQSARLSLNNELFEPAMFSVIHALELALKAALLTNLGNYPKRAPNEITFT